MPGDYWEDTQSSSRAGYPVYRCTGDGLYYNYICDLGNRLEVNLQDGNTVNIWIDDDDAEDFTKPAAEAPAEPAAELAPVAEVKNSGRYYTVYGADLEPVGVVKASSVAEAMKKAGRLFSDYDGIAPAEPAEPADVVPVENLNDTTVTLKLRRLEALDVALAVLDVKWDHEHEAMDPATNPERRAICWRTVEKWDRLHKLIDEQIDAHDARMGWTREA